MRTVITVRNDSVPDEGGHVAVYLQPTATSGRSTTQPVLVTGDPLPPGYSVTFTLEPDTHAVVVEARDKAGEHHVQRKG